MTNSKKQLSQDDLRETRIRIAPRIKANVAEASTTPTERKFHPTGRQRAEESAAKNSQSKSAPSERKRFLSRDSSDKKSTKFRAETSQDDHFVEANRHSCQVERDRRASPRPKNAITLSTAGKSIKTSSPASSLRKKKAPPAAQQSISNKHVVHNPVHHTPLDRSTSSDQDNTPIQVITEPHQFGRNTNLTTEVSAPSFLTQESSSTPNVGRAFCDRISITFNPDCFDIEDLLCKARLLSGSSDRHYTLKPLPSRTSDFYRHSYRLASPSGEHAALIQLDPKHKKMKFARIEFNPAEMGEEGMSGIRRTLKGLFGPNFQESLANGHISRLDATLDIQKLRPNDILIYSDRARDSGLWVRSFNRNGKEVWETETLTLGSVRSDYFAMAYDKSAQLWKVKGITCDELTTRIEVRFTPRDKNAASMCAKDILRFKNPFSPICISYYPSQDEGDYRFKFFICAVRWYGAEQALRMIKDRNLRSRYWNHLLDVEPAWWQPDKLWKQFLADIRLLGLFPERVFKNHEPRGDLP